MGAVTTYLNVDETKCVGHARCYLSAAPDLLEQDEEGYVSIRGSRLAVPVDQLEAAQYAVTSCPESAITLTEED